MTERDVLRIVRHALATGSLHNSGWGRVKDLSGPNDPTGISAQAGSIYRRTGASAGLYVNEDGTSTGWVRK